MDIVNVAWLIVTTSSFVALAISEHRRRGAESRLRLNREQQREVVRQYRKFADLADEMRKSRNGANSA